MLKWLHIKNLALVKEAALDFDSGFNAVTGETGAGKSVLMGGLRLLLGARFEKSAIREGADFIQIVDLDAAELHFAGILDLADPVVIAPAAG